MTNKMQLCRIIYYSLAAVHVSSDISAHHQEHLNCITSSGITHVCRCQLAFSYFHYINIYYVHHMSSFFLIETTLVFKYVYACLHINTLNPELNPICYLLALLGAHHFLHVSRIRVKSLTLWLLMSYIYIYIYIWSTYS